MLLITRVRADRDRRGGVERSDSTGGQGGPIDLITADDPYPGTWFSDDLRLPTAFGPGRLIACRRIDEFGVPGIPVVRLGRGKLC